MRRLIATLGRWWVGFWKRAGDVVDIFKPRGHVEARLYYATGPRKGQLARVIKGRNVVTSWLSGGLGSAASGRDMMRRILIPGAGSAVGAMPGELSSNLDATIQKLELGSGTTAESSADIQLESPLGGHTTPTSVKELTTVDLDVVSPWVTFVFDYSEAEANQTISEAALYSGRPDGEGYGRGDFIARKTFGAFTKTSEFTLQIRWQIRF
jgi:hypothetical protein